MIVLAREARQLNQHELAGRIHMSATNLSKIERGDVGISEDLLEAIAAITGYPRHFFNQPGEIVPGHLCYRKRQHVSQRLILPINARANIIRRHVQFLTRALQLEPQQLPSLPLWEDTTPAARAAELREHWEIEPGPIPNMSRLLESKGIALMSFDFGTSRVDSRSLITDEGHPLICLNSQLPGDRLRFSLAYELGLLVMHTGTSVSLERDMSHEASAFAAAFLMPEEDIRPDFENGISIALLGELKKKWKASMISILYRADDLGLLTPNQKRYLLQQFNRLQIRRREPMELDIPPEQARLLKHWIATYRSKTALGVMDISALLCLHIDEFMELYV
jgi:Zn-dependent peptidase ImmA (M78 family)/DNA-binding XRE family transcriptional regulator